MCVLFYILIPSLSFSNFRYCFDNIKGCFFSHSAFCYVRRKYLEYIWKFSDCKFDRFQGLVGTTNGSIWYINWNNADCVRITGGHQSQVNKKPLILWIYLFNQKLYEQDEDYFLNKRWVCKIRSARNKTDPFWVIVKYVCAHYLLISTKSHPGDIRYPLLMLLCR